MNILRKPCKEDCYFINESVVYLLDFLRSISASIVVISHIGLVIFKDEGNATFQYFIGFGHQAVVVFFVLSGFLISRSAIKSFFEKNGIIVYTIDRSTRLYAVLIPALLLTYLIDIIIINNFQDIERLGYIEDRLSLETFFGNLLFLQKIIYPVFGSNGPLWSLSYEFWYYVLFPLVISLLVFKERLSLVISTILILLVICFLPKMVVFYFFIWLVGAAIWGRVIPVVKKPISWLLFGFSFFLSGLPVFNDSYIALLFDFFIAVSVAMLIKIYMVEPNKKNNYNASRVFQWLASFSFSLYLIHFPIIILISALLDRGGYLSSQQSPSYNFFVIIFFLVYFVSYVFAFFSEYRTSFIKNLVSKKIFKVIS